MASQRHLINAPTTEAIIDFRVKIPSGFDTRKFLSVKEDLSNSYPKNEPRKGAPGQKLILSVPSPDGELLNSLRSDRRHFLW